MSEETFELNAYMQKAVHCQLYDFATINKYNICLLELLCAQVYMKFVCK